jgi:hypothetical protein
MTDHTIHFELTHKDPNNPLYMENAGGGFYVPKDVASKLFRDVERIIQKMIQERVKAYRAKEAFRAEVERLCPK